LRDAGSACRSRSSRCGARLQDIELGLHGLEVDVVLMIAVEQMTEAFDSVQWQHEEPQKR
jgi:hypothetical protein